MPAPNAREEALAVLGRAPCEPFPRAMRRYRPRFRGEVERERGPHRPGCCTDEDALADAVIALRSTEALDARATEPGALRRAEARLRQEIGVGDLNTTIAARRWHLEQEQRARGFDADSAACDHE
jgi:hypothetical protein